MKRPLKPEEIELGVQKGVFTSAEEGANHVIDEDGDLFKKEDFSVAAGARQAGLAVIPNIVGRGIGTALGAPLGPAGMIAGNIAGGAATGWLQDKLLGKLGKNIPAIARFNEAAEMDRASSPYLSMTSALAANPFGGGGIPTKIKDVFAGGAKQVAGQAALQGGIDAGLQYGMTGQVDPYQALIAAGGGAVLNKPNAGFRAFERGTAERLGIPQNVIDAYAPMLPADTSAIPADVLARTREADRFKFPHERSNYDPNWMLTTDVKNLQTIDEPFERAVAWLRSNEVPLTVEDIDRLSKGGIDYDATAKDIFKEKIPNVEAHEAEISRRLQEANNANALRKEVNKETSGVVNPERLASAVDTFKQVDPAEAEAQLAEINKQKMLEVANARNEAERLRLGIGVKPAQAAGEFLQANVDPAVAEAQLKEQQTQQMLRAANERNEAERLRLGNRPALRAADTIQTQSDPRKVEAELAAREEQRRLEAANEANIAQRNKLNNQKVQSEVLDKDFPVTEDPKGAVAGKSAEVIAGQGGGKAADKDLSQLKKDMARLKSLQKIAETLPEDSPDLPEILSMIEEHTRDMLVRQSNTLKGVGPKLPFAAKPEAPVTEKPATEQPVVEKPVPEKPETINEQMTRFREGSKRAVLLPPGTVKPELQKGEIATETVKGLVIHKNTLPIPTVLNLARQDKLGTILGYGVESKPAGASQAVVVETAKGVPVQEVAVTPETKPAAVEAAQKVAKEGDKITEKPLAQVVEARYKVGDKVKIRGTTHEISNITKTPTGIIIGWKNNSTNRLTGEQLSVAISKGVAELMPSKGTVTSFKVDNEAIEGIAGLVKSPSKLGKIAVDAVNAPEGTTDLAAYVKAASPEEQAAILKRYDELINKKAAHLNEFVVNKSRKLSDEEIEALYKKEGSGIKIKLGNRKEGGFIHLPIEGLRKITEPAIERIKKTGKVGYRYYKKFQALPVTRAQIENPLIEYAHKAESGVSQADRDKVHQYLFDITDTGSSDIQLSPELLKRAEMLRDIMRVTGEQKTGPNAPWVIEYENGSPIARPAKIKPGYLAQEIKPEILKVLESSKDERKIEALKAEYVQWLVNKKGITAKEAAKEVANRLFGTVTHSAPNPEFAALRQSAGVGFPPSWRMNIFDAVKKHVVKHSTDLAFHREIESDPILAKALGYKENGRGEAIPDVVLDEDGKKVSDFLARDVDVAPTIASYVGATVPQAQAFERFERLIKSAKIQTLSNIRDIATTPGILLEVMNPSELKFVMRGLVDSVSGAEQNKAIRAGATRPGRNMTPQAALDAADGASKLADMMNIVTGSESLNKMHRTFLYSVGRMIANNRLVKGDVEFLEKWGPLRWKNMDEELLKDYIATRISRSSAGSYDTDELPNKLLVGSGSMVKPVFSLARWSIGRFNRWYDNVWTEAKKGNIKPLIGSAVGALASAEAVNWITEMVTKRKPRELTWDEYLKLGGKDSAYTFFSKATTAGYAGILSDLAFAVTQGATGERPRGFNNLLFATGEDFAERVIQWANSDVNGVEELLLLTGVILRDNIQTLRVLTPREDTDGKREERLARRTGFMKAQSSFSTPRLNNPFSMAEAYRQDDPDRLAKIFTSRIKAGKDIPDPQSNVRSDPGYDAFIRQAQGSEAATSALQRDVQASMKKAQTQARAVSKVDFRRALQR